MSSTVLDEVVTQSLSAVVPPADYRLDCFVTNETAYNEVLVRCLPVEGTTGAFVGVGPDQNFTYAGALRSRAVVVVDARVDNLIEHLLFKLVAERAETPLEYLALLLSRDLPAGRELPATPQALVDAVEAGTPREELFEENLAWFTKQASSRWPLRDEHRDRLRYVYTEFFRRQLEITNVNEELLAKLDDIPTLRDILLAANSAGVSLHFLTDPERYRHVRELHLADRIVPMHGNITEPETVGRINEVLERLGERAAFLYVSNLEDHVLRRFVIEGDGVTGEPNPEGLLTDAYRALLANYAELSAQDDALLVRFFFPGRYRGRAQGCFPTTSPTCGRCGPSWPASRPSSPPPCSRPTCRKPRRRREPTMQATRLLVVDQGEYHAKKHIPERLVELGYRLTLVQWNSAVWLPELFEKVVTSRLSNWTYLARELRAEHERTPFAGVLSYNEGSVLAADEIARLLGLPRLSRFDAQSFRHKDRMRVAWESAGLPVPRYRVLHGRADARVLDTWDFPIVLKPTAFMGSKGVIKVERPSEVPALLSQVLDADLEIAIDGELWTASEAFDIPGLALAEEYVEGPEYSAEGVVIDGEYRLLGITRKLLGPEPRFDEVGHVFPSSELTRSQEQELRSLLWTAHTALGMDNAVTHTEFRLREQGFVLMELNARMAGDHITSLVELALPVDVADLAARCACGAVSTEELADRTASPRPLVAAVAFVTAPREAAGRNLDGITLAGLPDGCTVVATQWYQPTGTRLPEFATGESPRLGHVVLTAPDEATALAAVEAVRGATEVRHSAVPELQGAW